jgi:hypothetical protein
LLAAAAGVVIEVAAVLAVIENSPHNRWQSEQPIQSRLEAAVLVVMRILLERHRMGLILSLIQSLLPEAEKEQQVLVI